MSKQPNSTAKYKVIADSGGRHYQFFCEASGALVHTTNPIRAVSAEEELKLAWETEGRAHFNQCQKCGRWVSTVMYNADVFECVDCTPWENAPHFCKQCGVEISSRDTYCSKCGTKLQYGGDSD